MPDEREAEEPKVYLGDSVYVTSDGYGVILTTENGNVGDPSNTIYLEPSVLAELNRFVKQLERKAVTNGNET